MDQQQQHQHAQHQNLLYGDIPAWLFQEPFDENFLGTPQKPILNTDDQDSMMNFFDNPDQGLFGYQFTHDDPVEETTPPSHGSRQWHMNGLNGEASGSVSLAGQHPGYGAHGNSNTNDLNTQPGLHVTNGEWARHAQQPMMNNEDLRAADFLHDLKRQPVSEGPPSMNSSNFTNATWGNFAVHTNGNPNLPTQFRTLQAQGNQTPYTSASQPAMSSFSPQDIHQLQQMPWRPSMSHMPQPLQQQQRGRHLSLDIKQPMHPPRTPTHPDGSQSAVLPQEKPRPTPVRFGSDSSFGQHGYQGSPDMVAADKTGNLLNIPLATQAAKHARNRAQEGGQQRREIPGPSFSSANLGGLPMAGVANNHISDGSWGTMPPPSQPNLDAFSVEAPARKRRKSQHEHEDDAEYIPPEETYEGGNPSKRSNKMFKPVGSDDEGESSKTPAKRSKSAYASTNALSDRSLSPAIEDTDANADQGSGKKKARNSKKQRENLSESQKRQNHIQSEKKRRDVINNGYLELGKLVPCLITGKSGLSRSESLQEIASYLEVLVNGSNEVMSMLGLTEADLPATTSRVEELSNSFD